MWLHAPKQSLQFHMTAYVILIFFMAVILTHRPLDKMAAFL